MGSVAAASDDAVELEAKRKEDSSWHPCQVSLSSDISASFGLIVDFGSQECEEVIFTKEEVLERLRIRSIPVQGDECFQIKEGEHVLASQEAKFGILFFDAQVEKVCRVRHSKRNPCRCTFEIKWLYVHRGLGTVTVPASSIMKLARNTVDSHPTVGEFLNAVETFDCSGVSSIVSLLKETVFDTDLEKQIEEIGKFADLSKKGSPENGLLGLKRVDLTGQVRHRTIASQMSVLDDQSPCDQNNSRRTTRSHKKIQPESEKPLPPPKPVTAEPDRLHLSPLGARAALASLMYKLPSEPEFSAATHTTTISLDVTSTLMDSDVGIQEKVSIKESLHSSVEAAGFFTNTKVNSSDRSASSKFSRTTVMPSRLEKPTLMSNYTEDVGTNTGFKSPVRTTRLTRSAIQKGIGVSNDEIQSSEEMKISSHTNTPRFPRSAIQKEKLNATIEVNKGERELAQDTASRLTRLRNQKGKGHSDELKSSSEETKSPNPVPSRTPRFTRSAIQKETENEAVEVNKELEEGKLAQETCSDSPRENLVTPQTKEARRNKPRSSPLDDERNLSPAQENKKKQRVSNHTRITRSEGENSEAGSRLHDEKKSILSKTQPKLRSSPRLMSVPRTRSQKSS